MQKAINASKAETKTKRAVVEEALRMLVRIRAQEELRDSFGKFQFSDGYDYKSMRAGYFDRVSGKAETAKPSSRRATAGARGTRKRAA